MMRGLASADGVMVVPPHGVQLGEAVPAFPLPWGPPLPRPKPTEDKAKKTPCPAGPQGAVRAGRLERPDGLRDSDAEWTRVD